MGKVLMQSQPYPLSVTFNVFHQMTISPQVSVTESQSKGLYIGFLPQEIESLLRLLELTLSANFTDSDQLHSYNH